MNARMVSLATSLAPFPGTAEVGLDTYWHNRVGLSAPAGAPTPLMESRTLEALPRFALLEAD